MLLNSGIGEGKPGDPICIIAGGLSARVIYTTASSSPSFGVYKSSNCIVVSGDARNYVDIAQLDKAN